MSLDVLDSWLWDAPASTRSRTRLPWSQQVQPIARRPEVERSVRQAEAIFAAARAYVQDPEWFLLEDDEQLMLIQDATVPTWSRREVRRLIQAVADVDGFLREQDEVVEEIAATLRDDADPDLEIHTVTSAEACRLVRLHHRHLPACNLRGVVHTLGARWRGQLVAVALANAPTGRWKDAPGCPAAGILEITRVASVGGLRRTDRRGRDVPVGASSALVARLIDLLPTSGRGVPGCRLVTYQLTSEDGAMYRALISKGLRPVALSRHGVAGGARRSVALEGEKIRWEAGPAAGPPNWSLLQPHQERGARAAFAAYTRGGERT